MEPIMMVGGEILLFVVCQLRLMEILRLLGSFEHHSFPSQLL